MLQENIPQEFIAQPVISQKVVGICPGGGGEIVWSGI